MLTKTPEGLREIIQVFGNIDDLKFEAKNIVSFKLPYPLRYAKKEVTEARCHRKLVENFQAAFETIKRLELQDQCKDYGGIFNTRPIRGFKSHPSSHCWGISIDLENDDFPLGSKKRLPAPIIKAFTDVGFFYGGDFKGRKDPMHFQFATKY